MGWWSIGVVGKEDRRIKKERIMEWWNSGIMSRRRQNTEDRREDEESTD
jgi:hypothetical protein